VKRPIVFIILGVGLAVAGTSLGEQPQFTLSGGDVFHGGLVGAGRAARDTTYLLGGPGRLDGRFQDAVGNPDWHGWTHLDATDNGVARWHISDFNSPTGTPAIWCGQESFDNACGAGYGNNWTENLVFTRAVANPNAPTTVRLQCVFNSDSEPGFDYFRIQCNRGGTWQDVVPPYDDVHTGVVIDATITFQPADYAGPGGNEVQLRCQGFSESAWSDEDCLYDSDGLAQVDDLRVTIGGQVFADDFDDGTSQYWLEVEETGCGDFAKIWQNLQDVDPCVSNTSAQVAFIDDGVVVPGTGGSSCITWCYGFGGYIVNPTGGLLGPEHAIDNLIISPPLVWPAGNDGAILTFDVYRHEELVSGVSPGIFYQWQVRSAVDPAALASAPWQSRNFFYYGKNYLSDVQDVTDLLVPGRTCVQVALRCFQHNPLCWGGGCIDGTPAPYFDNVAVKAFPHDGPSLTARAIDLAQDSFPERGDLDLANLANNWVRFDMARNIASGVPGRNDPGDSILVDIALVRAGSVLNRMPKLVVKMKANPLFDAVRALPTNFTQAAGIVDGWVYGDSTRLPNGAVIANRYHFDLPDSNLIFPGDVVHYYVEAQDNVNGDVGTATLPADLTGFAAFAQVDSYPGEFTVFALPSVEDPQGHQVEVLVWNDAAGGRGEDAWYDALHEIVMDQPGLYIDLYETNGPSSGVGNGLGGRATAALLSGYEVLLYTCGDLGTYTLVDDLPVLTAWLAQGDKHAFMTGDDLVESLGSGSGLTFRQTYLGVQLASGNITPLIGNQIAPRVEAVDGNSLSMPSDAAWIAGGGCPGIRDFDAVTTLAGAETLARFCNPNGVPDYPYAAAWRYTNIADVVTLPYDLAAVTNVPDWNPPGPYEGRAWLLARVLGEFGHLWIPFPAVPEAGTFAVCAYPNPFNPRTTITLVMPQTGDAALKLYDIRGRLVRTLHEGPLAEGRHDLVWNGDDDAGRAVASGVYFYEVKAAGEERIGKLTLVR